RCLWYNDVSEEYTPWSSIRAIGRTGATTSRTSIGIAAGTATSSCAASPTSRRATGRTSRRARSSTTSTTSGATFSSPPARCAGRAGRWAAAGPPAGSSGLTGNSSPERAWHHGPLVLVVPFLLTALIDRISIHLGIRRGGADAWSPRRVGV